MLFRSSPLTHTHTLSPLTHTHTHTPAHAHPTAANIPSHLYTHPHTCTPLTPAHTPSHLHVHPHTCTHTLTPAHTPSHLHIPLTPAHTPSHLHTHPHLQAHSSVSLGLRAGKTKTIPGTRHPMRQREPPQGLTGQFGDQILFKLSAPRARNAVLNS